MQCIQPCPLWANSGHRDDHSIASSVTDSSDGGTVRSSVFAVLRLMANSKVTVSWERLTIMKGTQSDCAYCERGGGATGPAGAGFWAATTDVGSGRPCG